MRYETGVEAVCGMSFVTVMATEHSTNALALRHARAMKAVLLAARAWNRARESRRMMPDGLSAEYVTRCRLACACQRLAKIEKEVSRG